MAKPTESRELVRLVAAEFDRRAWSDPDELALSITNAMLAEGCLDGEAASALATDDFLTENGIARDTLRGVLDAVFAGRTLIPDLGPGPTVIDNSITIGDNNKISGAINVGGNQLTVTNNTPPAELLRALTDFVATATTEGFSPRELELLDRLAEVSGLDSDRLEAAARAGLERAGAEPGPLAKLRDSVIGSATSGLVVHAILAATGALL